VRSFSFTRDMVNHLLKAMKFGPGDDPGLPVNKWDGSKQRERWELKSGRKVERLNTGRHDCLAGMSGPHLSDRETPEDVLPGNRRGSAIPCRVVEGNGIPDDRQGRLTLTTLTR
jgi:hypothetical protein